MPCASVDPSHLVTELTFYIYINIVRIFFLGGIEFILVYSLFRIRDEQLIFSQVASF